MAGDSPSPPETPVSPKRETLAARAQLVLQLLDEDPSRTWTSRQVARGIDGKVNATKIALSRLNKGGKIRRVPPFLWQSARSFVQTELPDPRLRLHGLKVESRNEGVGWPYLQVLQRVSMVWASPVTHRHAVNHSITGTADWEGRRITWTVHKLGLIEVFMEASLKPLTLIDAYAFLTATLQAATGIPSELWKIVQADWNIDVPGSVATDLAITGLSVSGFGRFVAKVYEKVAQQLTRIEVRSFEPITADAVTGYIRSILAALGEAQARDREEVGNGNEK